jgi:DNA invertase Pin-like site-specific DNA recombinase
MSDSLRAVTYYRKSNEDDGESVEQQRKWARQAAATAGFEIVQEFTDQAKVGWNTAKRTAFHDMLAYCQEQAKRGTPVDVIACWHTNRFSRADSDETSWFVWEFRKAGVTRMFTSGRGWTDFARLEDRLVRNIEQDAMNHRYVVDLAQDSTRGRMAGAEEGRWMGGPIPYGYRAVMEEVVVKGRKRWRTARLVLGPEEEAERVRRLFIDYATTPIGLRGLAQRLTAAGVPPPRGGKRGWGTNTVKRILKNPVYLGRLVWGRRAEGKFFGVVDAKLTPLSGRRQSKTNGKYVWAPAQTHEPLTDLATFEQCQEKLARRKKEHQPRLGCYALSGLCRCGHCEGNMVPRVVTVKSGGKWHTYRRLLCGTYNRTGTCNYNPVDADALVRAVLRKLREQLYNPEALQALKEEIRRQDKEAAGGGPNPDALQAAVGALDRRIERAARRVLDEEDEAAVPALRKQLGEMQRERDDLARQLDALRRQENPPVDLDAAADQALAMMDRMEEALTGGDGDLLRELLGEAVSYVELFFTHRPSRTGRRTHSDYARGLIYLRPQVWADYIQVNGQPEPCRNRTRGHFVPGS